MKTFLNISGFLAAIFSIVTLFFEATLNDIVVILFGIFSMLCFIKADMQKD